jgi:putative membrane protein
MLNEFGVTPADLLGRGGESEVYALGNERVLRIYKQGVSPAYVELRRAFYADLERRGPPFEVPGALEAGERGGRLFVVERRMRGRDFGAVLPQLRGAERERALASFLEVAAQIGAIAMPGLPFGELLMPSDPIRRASWPQYLWDRAQRSLAASRADLDQDLPELDAAMARFQEDLAQVAGLADGALCHGDYFPANVFIDSSHTICGVGDFGYTTVVGHPLMDVAGAVAYIELADSGGPADAELMARIVAERHGAAALDIVRLYHAFYALYFSFCKGSDDHAYWWAVRSLRRYAVP